jgi:hypothetical protein
MKTGAREEKGNTNDTRYTNGKKQGRDASHTGGRMG